MQVLPSSDQTSTDARTPALPATDERVQVVLPCCTLQTQVRYRQGGRISLYAPQHLCAPVRVGAELTLRWLSPDGFAEAGATILTVRARRHEILALNRVWQVDLLAAPRLTEHYREHSRVPLRLSLCLVSGGKQIPVKVADLSEGGMRCVAGASAALTLGDVLAGTLQLGDEALRVRAAVVRTRITGRGSLELGLRFTDVSPGDAASIRRYLEAEAKAHAAEV